MRLRAALIAGFAVLALAGPAQADTFTVSNGSSDAAGSCAGTTCTTLRAAIAQSKISRPADVINVPAGTINLTEDLLVDTDVTIAGNSARTNILDGGDKYRGLRVPAGVTVTLQRYTIRRGMAGQAGSSDGGGVLNAGALTLDTVRVTDSQAARGGGVANLSGGGITIQHSLIDGNVAVGTGGGVANLASVETQPVTLVSLIDSTVFGNTGNGGAGGIAAVNAGGLIYLQRATVADNAGSTGAGGILTTATQRTQVFGSIVTRNRIGAAVSNCGMVKPTNGGANVEDNDTCGFGPTANPVLDTKLSNAGGEVDVLALGAGSAAVDRLAVGDNCEAGTLDQRGLRRPQGTACDSGAYELDVAATYTITGGVTGTISGDSAQIDFGSSDPSATPACQLTGPGQTAGYGACYKSNAALYTNLPNGTFTFSVRDADFPSSTPATRTFTVAALDSTITAGPDGPTNDTTPTFSFTGANGAVGFQCRVDAGTFAGCNSPFTTGVLTAGAHTFEVRALNGNGLPENTPASRSFTVDITAPPPPVITSPAANALLMANTVRFDGTAEIGATVTLREGTIVRGSAIASGTGLWTIVMGAVPDGPHTYAVTATDAAGNASGATTRSVTVDTGIPDTTITSGPSGPTNDATPTFTFTSEPGATFECSIDGVAHTACTSPFTTPPLAAGAHTLSVRAVDPAGNRDNTPPTRSFTVDTTPPPAPTVLSGPEGPTTDASPAFGFDAAGAAGTACRLDGPAGAVGEFGACTSPKAFSALAPGDYVFFVRATDAAGNSQTTQRAFTVTVPQQQATPTPTPTATPTPTPAPVANRTVNALPVSGVVLVKVRGAFIPLVPSLIINGTEVDARKGVVQITTAQGEVARFYDGVFKITQAGGLTTLTLTEKLTGCPKAKRSRASAAAAKPKTRRLWGDGKGRFKTKGQYSAATVRGTKWLVQDTCTTTLTRVTQGVVEVEDFAKKKKVLVKQGKRYTARPRKR